MTSEAHRLEAPPPAVSVKARAKEIEARSLAAGKASTAPVAPQDTPQVTPCENLQPLFSVPLSPVPPRRCSEGDIFLRCKPRPPPVAPKQRRVSHTALPPVPERRTRRDYQREDTSHSASFTSGSDVTDDFSPAIFSPTPQSPLDDIISALEKICDEFTLPETVDPESVCADDSQSPNSSLQRGNNDDVFNEKREPISKTLDTICVLNHSSQCHYDGLSQEAPGKASEKQFFSEEFNYVNPTFVLDDSTLEPEPIVYRSTLQFTPKTPQRSVITELRSPATKYSVLRSASSCSDSVTSRRKLDSGGLLSLDSVPSRSQLNSGGLLCSDCVPSTSKLGSGGLLQKFQSKGLQEVTSNCQASSTTNTSHFDSSFHTLITPDQSQIVKRNDCDQTDSPVRKAVVAFKPDLPKILTSSSSKSDSSGVKDNGRRRGSSPSEELEIVKNILAKLDFDKYKRRLSLETDRRSSDMEEKCSKPKKCSSSKFKDLFDLLKQGSDSASSKEKRPFALCRSSSFSNTEDNTYAEDTDQVKTPVTCANKMSTLPRRKSPTRQPLMKVTSPSVATCLMKSSTEIRNPDPTQDEGLVLDSDLGPGPCATAYSSCNRLGHFRSASDNVTTANNRITAEFIAMKKTSSTERLWSTVSSRLNGTEKRKRRKGVQEIPSKGTGRSLTYPPQRKSSTSEEEHEFTSVDSNGLKSLNLLTAGLMGGEDSVRMLSELSLADSHLCPSEGTVDEIYQDSVMHSPPDTQYLSVDSSKPYKKKHHSDPGGEACSPGAGSVDKIGSSRSEPELGGNEILATISSSCSSASSETSSRATQTSNPNLEDQQHNQLKLIIDGQPSRIYHDTSGSLTSGATPSSRFLFPEHQRPDASKSPQEQRRYSKRRLRGPYGEMLEEEMRKSGEKQKTAYSDLSFLQDTRSQNSFLQDDRRNNNKDASTGTDPPTRTAMFLSSQSLDDASSTSSRSELSMCVTPKRKISANYPLLSDGDNAASDEDTKSNEAGQRANDKDNNSAKNSPQQEIKRESTRTSSQDRNLDTRTHVVYEILDTERSYVDSLQTLVTKYMGALKSTDYNGVVEGGIVDEIFFQIPEILNIHEEFLDALSQRCINWDVKFTIGDLFIEAFTKQQVIDTYTAFINNWKCAKDATKIATQAKPAFARFLEHMSREHKGKLALDALLIMPVQRIPRYELLIKELLKHTPVDHPDHHLLVQAQKEVHDLAVKINRVEREAFQIEQMQQRIREIEQHIDGMMDLCIPDRAFIRHDVVTIPGGLGTKKERCLFLFSDVLLITSIKKKSTAMRKPSSTPVPSTSHSPFSVLDSNKYKLLTRFSLESMEISKSTDVSLKKAMKDIATLEEDIHILNQIKDLVDKLSSPHQTLEDVVRDLTNSVSKQMLEKQNNDYSLISLEMTVTTQERIENLTIQFTSPERRAVWSAAFNEAKQKLAISTGRRPPPELKKAMPIRKTRAGLQFTCATATLGFNQQGLREVWVCNSDGYVGQVCVLSLLPEPTVMSCNGVCNARILTIASIPATCTMMLDKGRWRSPVTDTMVGVSIEVEEIDEESIDDITNNGNIQLDSDSSDDDDTESTDEERGREDHRKRGNSIPREEGQEDMDNKQPTMWLGTEDGCVHVYNCNDNIRTKKNKIKIQHTAAIQCIIYLDNRVFVSIANGEVHIYKKETDGGWCTSEPQKVTIGSSSAPVTIMLAVAGKLWCGCQNSIHVLNTGTLQVEHSFAVSSDTTRYVLCIVTSGLGVWVTVTPSAVIRLFHATNYEPLLDVNVAPTVAKILSATDDIIKQHKSACLRVTAMLTCKDLLWIGTSAGVILTLPLPHLTSATLSVDNIPPITGLPHGHTGHVRFLTSVEMTSSVTMDTGYNKYSFRSTKSKESTGGRRASTTASAGSKLLVISGGDGYEDFQTSGLGEQAGHDDSTNHLLLWQV